MNASDPPGTGLWEETMGSSSDGYSFFDLDSFINLDGSTTTTTDSMSTDDVEHRNMFRLSVDGNSSSNMANNNNDDGTSPPTSYRSDERAVVVCMPVDGAVDLGGDAHLNPFCNEAAGTAEQQQQLFYQQKQIEPQLELHRRRHLSSPSRSLEVAASVSDSEILRLEDLSVCSPRRPVAAAAAHVPASAPASRRGSPTKPSSGGGRMTSMCSRIYEKAATTLARPSRSPVRRTQTEQQQQQQQQQHIKLEAHHSYSHHHHHQHNNNHMVLPETPVATPLLGHETVVVDVADKASRDAFAAAAGSGWAAGPALWTGAQFEVQQGQQQQFWGGLPPDRPISSTAHQDRSLQQQSTAPPPPGTIAARRSGHGGGPTVSLSQLDLSGGGDGGSNSLMIQMPQPRGPPHASVQQTPESQYPLPPDGGDLAYHHYTTTTTTATYQPPGPSTAPMPAPADGTAQQQQQQHHRTGSTHLYRRPKPRAPSSGARHRNGAPAGPPPPLPTSPRKASSGSGSGSGSGPRSATSPSPGLRTSSTSSSSSHHHHHHHQQHRRSASTQSLRDAAAASQQPGAVRKRRSFTAARQSCSHEAVAAAVFTSASASSSSSCPPYRVPRKALSTSNLISSRGGSGGSGNTSFAAPPGSFGFVNYTARDHDVLMAGVAPSGSAKTKARRERETLETIERERRRQRVLADALSAVGADVSVLKYEGIAI